MAGSNLPKGLITDLITPLTEDGSVDGRGLGKLLDILLPHVQGILISGPWGGEGCLLSIEQRLDLFDKALVVVRGAVPILVWITGKTPENTVEILGSLKKRKEARKYNGDVLWVDSPLYYHSNRGLPEYYADLCSDINEPLILYNDPLLIQSLDKSLKRNNIRTGVLKELSLNERIGGLIYSGPIERVYNYRKAVRNRPDFRICDGDESRFLDHPGYGGVVSVGSNIACREWAKITSSSLNSDMEESYPDQQRQMWDIWSCLSGLMSLYSTDSAGIIKKVLEGRGVISGPVQVKDENILNAAMEILENY